MKIHLIKEQTIRNYVLGNARSKVSFEDWISKIKLADWGIPKDIKKTFNSADLLGKSSNRVVFDIVGGNYRLIIKVEYTFGVVYVSFFGTHQEYDKINANTINLY